MLVPHDVNNNPVGRVRWHRSLDLVTSEEVTAATDKYVFNDLHFSELVQTGDFAGLYNDLYVLSIINISSSDNGYYWCQIISDQTCLSPSPYVNISVVTATKDKCSFTHQHSPVCAVTTNVTCDHQSSEVMISPTATQAMLSSSSAGRVSTIATASSSPESNGQQTVHIVTSYSPNKNGPVHLAVIVAVPAAAFVLLLISLLFVCAGIYMCQRKARKRKGKQPYLT